MLEIHRERSFIWGYGHMIVFGSLVAMGAGLHVAAYELEGKTTISDTGTVLCTVIPVAVYIGALYALYASFTRHMDPFHLGLIAGTAAVLVLAIVLAALGISIATCLIVVMFAPLVTVVGYETLGHRHLDEAFGRMRDEVG